MTPDQLKKLETDLWRAADSLRANSDLKASEYSTPVLGLIFLKFADNKFKQYEAEIHKEFAKLNENTDLSDCGGGGIGSFFFRPPLIQFNNCSNVLLDGFTTSNSPFWNTHLVYCTKVTVKNTTFQNPPDGVNGDGPGAIGAAPSEIRREHQAAADRVTGAGSHLHLHLHLLGG